MAAVVVTIEDLLPFAEIDPAKAQAMIDDALAMAATVAPCVKDAEFAYPEAAKAVIRGAVLRWNEAGTGAVTQVTNGPFSQTIDNRQQRRGLFWPSEIAALRELCNAATGKAFTIDTTARSSDPSHADICALNFGALYCSCGAVLTNLFPLYEV